MHKIIDNFYADLYCSMCNKITEHNVQKVDEEGDGRFIGYYGKCDVCGYIDEYSTIEKYVPYKETEAKLNEVPTNT